MSAPTAVVGSVNLDVVISLQCRPSDGETVLGDQYVEVPGGKGANQATAAARTGSCALVGSVGDDSAANDVLTALRDAGVDVAFVHTSREATGRAFITLTSDGENSIIVVPGANSRLTADQVTGALDEVRPVVVLCQLEITDAAVMAAAAWCADNGSRFILNASPVRPLPATVRDLADPLVVNTVEASILLDATALQPAEAARLLSRQARSVVLTAGSDGAYVAVGGDVHHVPAQATTVSDTTGAGDAFAGALASRLACESDLVAATRAGNIEAARVVSLPRTER